MKWKKNKYLYLSVIIALVVLYSCEKVTLQEPPPITTPVLFSTDIKPIFKKNGCTNCHFAGNNKLNLTDDPYTSLINNGCINTSTPANSEFYLRITSNPNHQHDFTDAPYVLAWITQGAKNN